MLLVFTREWTGAICYPDFSDILESILKTLIETGKGLEVNTKGIDSTGDTLPSDSILRRYHELGGEVITLGSDAHVPERVGDAIEKTAERLKAIGFKYYSSFTLRKLSQNKL